MFKKKNVDAQKFRFIYFLRGILVPRSQLMRPPSGYNHCETISGMRYSLSTTSLPPGEISNERPRDERVPIAG